MSSTDLDAPPLKSLLLAIVAVLGLHVLAAIALVAIKTPELKPEPKKEMSPLEIKFVSLPAKTVSTEVEKQTVTAKKEVPPEVQVQPAPQPEPKPKEAVRQPTETPVKPKEPVVKKYRAESDACDSVRKASSYQSKVASKEPLPKPRIDNSAAEAQRQAAAQAESERQARKAEQEAQARAEQEAKRVADAKAAAQAKAAAEAAAAQARAEAEAAAALAQSNEPVSFTASSANWASAPKFSFPERAARRARSGDTLNIVLVLRVNKQGGIDNVRVAQSSGNPLVDKEARRQVRSGKFKPFTKNGVPVVGDVTLPISYAVP
ncbi:LOW QUALITY PROTEIN: ferric siderophore transport system, periplasmic binding protein TonB [Psychrobacter sp. JCM 18900]|nr:LOW QUALITY PROTEIN: ferric siderophore transport system, periplasmic binding protein TonB [Psychrobacter sp. JCM 18900]